MSGKESVYEYSPGYASSAYYVLHNNAMVAISASLFDIVVENATIYLLYFL